MAGLYEVSIINYRKYREKYQSMSSFRLYSMYLFGSAELNEDTKELIDAMIDDCKQVVKSRYHEMQQHLHQANEIIDLINSKLKKEVTSSLNFEMLDFQQFMNTKPIFETLFSKVEKAIDRFNNNSTSRDDDGIYGSRPHFFQRFLNPTGDKSLFKLEENEILQLLTEITEQMWREAYSSDNYFDHLYVFSNRFESNLTELQERLEDYELSELILFYNKHQLELMKYNAYMSGIQRNTYNEKTSYAFDSQSYFKHFLYDKGKLVSDSYIPTKQEKDRLRAKLNVFELEARALFEKPSLESYLAYRNKFQSFIQKDINYTFFADYDRFIKLLGPYSKLLVSDYFDKGRFNRSLSRINIRGNQTIFHLFSKYRRIVVFDTETTGLDPKHDRIIEFGYAIYELHDTTITCTQEVNFLIQMDRGQEITERITSLTGITKQELTKQGLDIKDAVSKIGQLFSQNQKTLFVAYNAPFDLSFLIECTQNKNLFTKIDILDLYAFFGHIDGLYELGETYRKLENRKLETVVKALNIKHNQQQFHRAIYDAQILIEILKKIELYGMGESLLADINYMASPKDEFYKLDQVQYHDLYDSKE